MRVLLCHELLDLVVTMNYRNPAWNEPLPLAPDATRGCELTPGSWSCPGEATEGVTKKTATMPRGFRGSVSAEQTYRVRGFCNGGKGYFKQVFVFAYVHSVRNSSRPWRWERQRFRNPGRGAALAEGERLLQRAA